MKAASRESTFVLRECARCHYAACICAVLKHAPTCPWRLKRLDTRPVECDAHQAGCCELCFPCDCGKPTRPVVKVRKEEVVA